MKALATLLLAAAFAAAIAAAPAAAAPTTIAPLAGATEVRAHQAIQVWSDRDAADKRWHVVVRRAGVISIPPIPSAKDPIEVDVGPGPGGAPVLAYTRCTSTCRVVIARVDGSNPRTVPHSGGASSPTVWGSRVAWIRGRATVMVSALDGRGRKVLPGAPRRTCAGGSGSAAARCERPRNASVDTLELHGSQLALVDSFTLKSEGDLEYSEVRTESIRGGPQRLVARMGIGEAGQTWVGPSWAKGKLFVYKACFGDTSGCSGRAGGVLSFDPARRTYARASSATVLTGFAIDDDGRRAYQATSGGPLDCGDEDAAPCLLRITDPLTFTAAGSRAPGT